MLALPGQPHVHLSRKHSLSQKTIAHLALGTFSRVSSRGRLERDLQSFLGHERSSNSYCTKRGVLRPARKSVAASASSRDRANEPYEFREDDFHRVTFLPAPYGPMNLCDDNAGGNCNGVLAFKRAADPLPSAACAAAASGAAHSCTAAALGELPMLEVFVAGDTAYNTWLHLAQRTTERPMVHDLMWNMLQRAGGLDQQRWHLLRVAITKLRDNVFHGRLFFGDPETGEVTWDCDCRPSDGCYLSIRSGAPMYVHRRVWDMAARPLRHSTVYQLVTSRAASASATSSACASSSSAQPASSSSSSSSSSTSSSSTLASPMGHLAAPQASAAASPSAAAPQSPSTAASASPSLSAAPGAAGPAAPGATPAGPSSASSSSCSPSSSSSSSSTHSATLPSSYSSYSSHTSHTSHASHPALPGQPSASSASSSSASAAEAAANMVSAAARSMLGQLASMASIDEVTLIRPDDPQPIRLLKRQLAVAVADEDYRAAIRIRDHAWMKTYWQMHALRLMGRYDDAERVEWDLKRQIDAVQISHEGGVEQQQQQQDVQQY